MEIVEESALVRSLLYIQKCHVLASTEDADDATNTGEFLGYCSAKPGDNIDSLWTGLGSSYFEG